tara:strand:- start:423 stop:1136 length:714 start_codon:yes stop_codon:yes gene_type:complete
LGENIISNIKIRTNQKPNHKQIPYLRGDDSVLAFLSVQTEKDWEQAQQVTAQPNLWNSASQGSIKWREALRSAEIPHNGLRILMDFITQLDYMEGHLKKMVNDANKFAATAQAKKNDLVAFNSNFAEWAKTETEFGNGAKFEYPNKDSEQMGKLMRGSTDALNGWASVSGVEPTIIDNVVCAFLAFQLQQVESFKALIRDKDAALRELQKNEKVLATKKEERDKKGGQSANKSMVSG